MAAERSQWEVAFQFGREWKDVNRRLRHAGEKDLARELRKAVREAAKPGRNAAKLAARAIPVKGPRSTGLRRRMARGVGIQADARRVRIVTRMPSGLEMLPRGFDTAKGWRHPVFGNRERWVTQPGHPWFRQTIAKTAPKAREEMKQAMDRVAARIAQ
ncbi:hypothetical protein [Nonomuraea gerenzanensis]|uniref:Phage protein, HK97 gp10 family n=1 Tax=Nonomuraea gerenzanensis TaxID=93944 RepID=A0A1M4EMM8_9ACTN|nr:hypothetical protein [Nonomuraea gerenzanensis]UBU11601.1 hypothetical protein LCN96_46065 [Nonomuraea gerenzanensis]SBP00097.1 hypothetical protein BN4615_P9613 [Nonomuraea gerenzanensis]